MNRVFGCDIHFPELPEPKPARVELQGYEIVVKRNRGETALLDNVDRDDSNILFLAYDTYTIHRALYLYRSFEANFRQDPENFVFIFANKIAIRTDSEVLRRELLERLTESFSKLPRGQAYVNQSYNYIVPILHAVNGILSEFMLLPPEQLLVRNFLQRIRAIPNLLTENPYNPREHDVSKFVDFEENPQYYRNKWIIYFINEMCNSGDNHLNLFNHMKLFILLFRYLTMLPTVNIDGNLVILQDTRTTPNALQREEDLINENYRCDLIAVRINELPPEITAAQEEIRVVNEVDQAAIDDAAIAAANAAHPPRRRVVRGRRYQLPPPVGAADAGLPPPPGDHDDMAPVPNASIRSRRVLPSIPAAAAALAGPFIAPLGRRSFPFLTQLTPVNVISPSAAAAMAGPLIAPRAPSRVAAAAAAALANLPNPVPNPNDTADLTPPPSSRQKTRRGQQGGITKVNNHTRRHNYSDKNKKNNNNNKNKNKNKPKYANKLKLKKSKKSKKQNEKSKHKKSKINVSFKRRKNNN
jgi:hypothetical protein